ncbi:MAG: hypothetical protein KatS3mg119_1945 [Rhodothalassiaceae bacterium]|nr:MAG: hypothetical protein KatS3mg119_1945 [Rhodothalassiaceae bacterium]
MDFNFHAIHLYLKHLIKFHKDIDVIKINQGRILSRLNQGIRVRTLSECEFKVFSQWGEDGIIQYLVAHLDIPNKTFIEFGVEDFSESNCRFLMMKDYWSGYVIDANWKKIARLRTSYYYWQYRLFCKTARITKENANDILLEGGFGKNPGILSIDIDGVDWHILSVLTDWRPSILIVEYNDVFGFDVPISIPYDPNFVREKHHFSNLYWGANLPAFTLLANKMDMAFVGTNGAGSNAFFVSRNLLNDVICEVDVDTYRRERSFSDSRSEDGRLTVLRGDDRRRVIAHMPVVNVLTGEMLLVRDIP